MEMKIKEGMVNIFVIDVVLPNEKLLRMAATRHSIAENLLKTYDKATAANCGYLLSLPLKNPEKR